MHDLIKQIRTEIHGMWRYRWAAMFVTWVICIGAWTSIFSMPDIYEASAKVYVDADSRLAEVMGQVGVAPGVGSRVFVVRQAMLGRPQLERVARETDLDLRARTEERIGEVFEHITRAGGGRILHLEGSDLQDHPGGGCRMGEDPATSVVDAFGRSHDHPNLWVVGAPTMVTGGCNNGTLTFCALALRSAAMLAAELPGRPAWVRVNKRGW